MCDTRLGEVEGVVGAPKAGRMDFLGVGPETTSAPKPMGDSAVEGFSSQNSAWCRVTCRAPSSKTRKVLK